MALHKYEVGRSCPALVEFVEGYLKSRVKIKPLTAGHEWLGAWNMKLNSLNIYSNQFLRNKLLYLFGFSLGKKNKVALFVEFVVGCFHVSSPVDYPAGCSPSNWYRFSFNLKQSISWHPTLKSKAWCFWVQTIRYERRYHMAFVKKKKDTTKALTQQFWTVGNTWAGPEMQNLQSGLNLCLFAFGRSIGGGDKLCNHSCIHVVSMHVSFLSSNVISSGSAN